MGCDVGDDLDEESSDGVIDDISIDATKNQKTHITTHLHLRDFSKPDILTLKEGNILLDGGMDEEMNGKKRWMDGWINEKINE